jgi:hypothetical protein
MNAKSCWLGRLLLAAIATSFLWVSGHAAPAPDVSEENFKDREAYIPKQKHEPQGGKVIGVLAGDVTAIMGREGRGGPQNSYGFGRNGHSYRWVYVPGGENPIISNLQVRTGEKGDAVKVYPKLDMANPETIKQFGFSESYCLVEIEVNDGLGSPAEEAFVATKMTRVDGTKDYPLKVTEVVDALRKKYDGWMKDQERTISDAMTQAQTKSIKDAKPTGPKQTNTVMLVTWMAESQRLQVRFLTRISDGAFQNAGPGGIDVPPVPVPPGGKRRPPPPPPQGFRTGTEFGIEFGVAYEVNRNGTVERVLKLPIESFENKILAPQGPQDRLTPFDPPPLPPGKN